MCQILPTLKFCAERDETVAIQLCVLGCYDAVAKRLDKLGPVATHILPACTPMLACKGLNSNQFEMAVGIIQGMLESIIAYRRREIANPRASAIIENKPTHPGGEPDQAEIARQRAIALGGWKPASASSSSKPRSQPASPTSLSFPRLSASSSPAPVAAASTGFDVADIFSSPPASAGTAGAQSAAFSGNLTPLRKAPPVATGGVGDSGARASESGAGSFAGSTPAANMFEGLSVLQKKPASNGAVNTTLSSGSSDPFASAGLGESFGSTSGQGTNNLGSTGGGMSWMDDAFGGGGGGGGLGRGDGGGGLSSSGMGGLNQAPGKIFAAGMGGLSGFGGAPRRASSPPSGILPPPKPPAGRASPPAKETPAGDPFAAFFDAAIAGSPGLAGSPQMTPSASPALPAVAGGSGTLMGAFAPASAGGGEWNAGGVGSTSGGGTLEDQLVKTQREIAQLTRELGGVGVGAAMEAAAGGMSAAMGAAGGMSAAMGAAGGGGWGIPGASAPAGGNTGVAGNQGWPGRGGGAGQAPAQQAQGTGAQDPFAFLAANSQGGQQGSGQTGAGSGFDFFR